MVKLWRHSSVHHFLMSCNLKGILQALGSLVASLNGKKNDPQILPEKEYTAALFQVRP